jgi:hypothetical protein
LLRDSSHDVGLSPGIPAIVALGRKTRKPPMCRDAVYKSGSGQFGGELTGLLQRAALLATEQFLDIAANIVPSG